MWEKTVRRDLPAAGTATTIGSCFGHGAVADAIDSTKRVFAGIKAKCGLLGVPVGIVMIPTLQQVEGKANDAPNRLFAEYFPAIGVPFADLLPAMRGRRDLYYPIDQHWYAARHRLAAGEVAQSLLNEASWSPIREGIGLKTAKTR